MNTVEVAHNIEQRLVKEGKVDIGLHEPLDFPTGLGNAQPAQQIENGGVT